MPNRNMSQQVAIVAVGTAACAWYFYHRTRRQRRSRLDFGAPVDRAHPSLYTVKHGLAPVIFGKGASDALPLWVADMELPCCPHICRALSDRAAHPTFGYTFQPTRMWELIGRWLVERQHWPAAPEPSSFVFSCSVVASFANVLDVCTRPGDGVLVMTPLYSPLQVAVSGAGRRLVTHELCQRGASYDMAIDDLVKKLNTVKLLLLCNPQNPSGRVWRREELAILAAACAARRVVVVSDEIWADWVLPLPCAAAFTPFRAVAKAAGCGLVTLGAPTKTWNLAGLHASYVVIEDEALRTKYLDRVEPATLHYGSTFATVATLAAYEHGGAWLDRARVHVAGNLAYLTAYLKEHMPAIVPMQPEATYLVWLDCAGLGLEGEHLEMFFLENARLLLSPGSEFGEGCGHWMRINIACGRPFLEEAMQRLQDAYRRLHWQGS